MRESFSRLAEVSCLAIESCVPLGCLTMRGVDSWIRTAELAFFVALGYLRFVDDSRPASRRYPLRGRCREPLGFCIGLRPAIAMPYQIIF